MIKYILNIYIYVIIDQFGSILLVSRNIEKIDSAF